MYTLQDRILRTARVLGLQVRAPADIDLGDGRSLHVEALFPELGGPRGIAVASSDVFSAVHDELTRLGFAYSVLSEESYDDGDLGSIMEMFTEWGWSAASPKPDWMSGRDEETGRRIKRLRRVVTVLDDANLIDEVEALAPFVGVWIRRGTANHQLLAWSESLPEDVLQTTFGPREEAGSFTLIDDIEMHHAGHGADRGFEFDGPADELDLWFLTSAEEDRRRIVQELQAIGASIELKDPSRIRARVVYSN